MADFIPGQRWISEAELQLGLGTVLTVDHRSVTIVFLASGETRIYSKTTAPLTRLQFAAGDSAQSHEGWTLKVESVSEEGGLLTYHGSRENGEAASLHEGQLDNFIQLNRPVDRLFTGQIDQSKWFELRYQTLQQLGELAHSELRGLGGGRTSLIPHQLYIAHEVANRYAPRVLLADEVGLGKTIEAGLIVHHQLLSERARRVLIVVPETLMHQWLVEMLRRFNLHFAIFDEERCLAAEESTEQDNPFHTEQLVLCSLGFLQQQPHRFQQALGGEWDLLVVDEAHHLQWSPEEASLEYQMIEALAQQTKGVLLLTATPEQLGKQSHFARLRLLDADRFPDFDSFVKEEQGYEPIAQAVEDLLGEAALGEAALAALQGVLAADGQQHLQALQTGSAAQQNAARTALVAELLDRHGTGRVLFRNTRAAVKGFPERQLHAYPLDLPDAYADCLREAQASGISDAQHLLSIELLFQTARENPQAWTQIDPRIEWLQAKLKSLRNEKVLVITHSAETALDIADALRIQAGMHAAVFHEGMSIVERDRAAAFFADMEYGTPVLVCSEIGSEGRNFQFAHHLVMFDLPLNPDLLEQRIGRLDRIGQAQTIQIHVPYLQNSAQEVMYRWYQQGLSAFEQTCPAGHSVFVKVQAELLDALHQIEEGMEDLEALLATSKQLHDELNEALHKGRDRLLEYNSCRPQIAEALKQGVAEMDAQNRVQDYAELLFDCYGVDTEEHSDNAFIIRPSEHMQTAFPGLLEDGMTITYDRDTALANEDMHYLTWEHPMILAATDMLLSSELGNTSVSAIQYKGIRAGTLLLECSYLVEPVSNEELPASRYLPLSSVRVVVDENGRDYAAQLDQDSIAAAQIAVDAKTAGKIIKTQARTVRQLIDVSEKVAQGHAPKIQAAALQQSQQLLNREIARLQALRQVNPNVRVEEIQFFEKQLQALEQALQAAHLRMDAVRVIVVT